jgi:hypothetical protein
METRLQSDYPCGACTWSCTAGTPGCRPCARTRSTGGTPGSRRRRRRRRRLPPPWYPRRRRRSGTPARRRASPSALIHQERFSHSIPRSTPAQMPPRNTAALATHHGIRVAVHGARKQRSSSKKWAAAGTTTPKIPAGHGSAPHLTLQGEC